MSRTTVHFTQDYEDREYETAIDERMEELYAQAYKNQRRREEKLWEQRRKSGTKSAPE